MFCFLFSYLVCTLTANDAPNYEVYQEVSVTYDEIFGKWNYSKPRPVKYYLSLTNWGLEFSGGGTSNIKFNKVVSRTSTKTEFDGERDGENVWVYASIYVHVTVNRKGSNIVSVLVKNKDEKGGTLFYTRPSNGKSP
jgi:hypothetical protein